MEIQLGWRPRHRREFRVYPSFEGDVAEAVAKLKMVEPGRRIEWRIAPLRTA